MKFISDNIKAFKSEWIKLKGTGIWWMIGGTCAFMVGASLLISIYTEQFSKPSPGDPWPKKIEDIISGFMFFYILLSILMVVRLCQTEHRNQGWKLIETQPIHRVYLFLAKFKMAIILSLVSLLLYLVISIISAYGFALYKNDIAFREHSIPWMRIISYIIRIWIASWGFIAFQYMLSIWISNFTIPFLIGFVCTVVAMSLPFSGTATWFPFAAPVFSAQNFNGGLITKWLLHYEKLSVVWMLLFLWVGYQYYFHRDWKHSLLTWKQALKFLVVAAIFSAVFYFIEKPVEVGRYTKTVIAGELASVEKLRGNLVLINPDLMDTVMVIPVQKGSFHAVYTGTPLRTGKYALAIGSKSVPVFMGHHDSVYISWDLEQLGRPPQVKGTRMAENSMWRTYEYQDYMGTMKNKPSVFASSLLEQWKSGMETIEEFKTVDNVRPSQDFIDMTKKLTTVSYLQALDIDYPGMHAMYYPGDTLKYPSSMDPVFKTLDYNDSTMLMYKPYVELLDRQLRKKNNLREFDNDSSYLEAVVKSDKDQRVKDVMLYHAMNKMISNGDDSLKRNYLFSMFIVEQKDPQLSGKLYERLAIQNSLVMGLPAPEFEAVSIAGKKMGLKDFKGRHVVLDVWATWCAPCRQEAPFFERYAEKYAGDKVAFLSLSVDEGTDNVFRWQFEAPTKSKRVVQLRAEEPFSFMNSYGIESIPRFMLIDPQGKITRINMPRPSESFFEEYLKQQVPAL